VLIEWLLESSLWPCAFPLRRFNTSPFGEEDCSSVWLSVIEVRSRHCIQIQSPTLPADRCHVSENYGTMIWGWCRRIKRGLVVMARMDT
jgi:hypothetical protein